MSISIYDSVAGQVPRDYFLETEGPLASDDTFKTTPIQLGAMFFESQSANYESKAGEIILANVEAAGSFTVDLPAAPLVNQKVGVVLKTKTTAGRYVGINPNGKNINGNSANVVLNVQDWGLIVQYDGAEWRIISDLRFPAYFSVCDEKASTTVGGTFTAGAWRTRDLTTLNDDHAIASLSSNQITLPAGTYRFRGSAPAYRTNQHQTRFYNVTDDTVVAVGTSESSSATYSNTNRSMVAGQFTISAEKAFAFEHRCAATYTTHGFGLPANNDTERYAELEFWKVA